MRRRRFRALRPMGPRRGARLSPLNATPASGSDEWQRRIGFANFFLGAENGTLLVCLGPYASALTPRLARRRRAKRR